MGWPEFFIYLLPIVTGILGGKYLRRLANFFNFSLMIAVWYVGLVAVLFQFFSSCWLQDELTSREMQHRQVCHLTMKPRKSAAGHYRDHKKHAR